MTKGTTMEGRALNLIGGRPTGRTLAAAGAVTAALLLAACGSGGSSSGTAAPASSTTATATAGATASTTPSPSTAAASTEKLADGSTRITDPEAGYQLVLPRGYTRITSKDQLAEIAKAGSKALKQQSQELTAAAFQKNVKVFAVNKITGGTINLVVVDAGGATSADLQDQADTFESLLRDQLGAKDVSSSKITIDGDPGLRADGTVNRSGTKVRLTQLYAVHADQVFIVTVGGASSTPESVIRTVAAGEHFTG
jgi:hypothetical protein